MTTASPILPAPRFTVNAHGDADMQARLEAAAPLLEALFLGRGLEPVAAAVAALRSCQLCHDSGWLGGTDPDGNEVHERCGCVAGDPKPVTAGGAK